MFEGDPTATTPITPLAPPPPPVRKGSGIPAGRLVALGLLAFVLAAFSGRIDLGSLVSTAQSYVDRAAPAVQTNTSSSDTGGRRGQGRGPARKRGAGPGVRTQ